MRALLLGARAAALVGLGAAPLAPAHAQAQAQAQAPIRPLELADAAETRNLVAQGEFAALSPDGRRLAYAVVPSHTPPMGEDDDHQFSRTGVPWNAVGAELRLTDLRTGETRTIAGGEGTHWVPSWSPDGRTLLFFSDRDGAQRLWAWDAATGTTRRVSPAIVRAFFGWETVRWLPDGRHVVLKVLPDTLDVARANALSAIWTVPASSASAGDPAAREPDALPGATVAVYRAHAAAADDTTSARTTQAVLGLTPNDSLGPTRYFGDLVVLDVTTGRVVRRLVEGGRVLAYRLSPDGTRLALTEYVNQTPTRPYRAMSLSVVALATGEIRRLVAHERLGFGGTFSWSPDGKTLAYVTESNPRPGVRGRVCAVPASGGAARCLGGADGPDLGDEIRPPLWGPDSDALYVAAQGRLWKASVRAGTVTPLATTLARRVIRPVADASEQRIWSPDGGRSLHVETRDTVTAQVGFHRVDARTGEATRLREEPANYGHDFHAPIVSADGRTVVYPAEDAQHPTDVWAAGADFSDARRVTRINPALEQYAFGEARLVTWRTMDGLPARGALLLPARYEEGKRYPLVVRVYGGLTGAGRLAYRFGLEGTGFSNMQMLATRGYAVLYPDIPQRLGTPMRDIAAAVLPGVDKVIDLGIADPERLGVFGQSYGGYSTISLLVQTPRFKGAAMSAGIADLVSGYGEFHKGGAGGIRWSETGQGLMGGTPWEYRERYLENSPILYLDRVTTPLMIIHGDRDLAVPVWQSDAVFVGLRRLGREVEYRRYVGEEHTIRGPANMRDYWSALVRWFDTHVKGADAPALSSR